jgi:hypothetical protein
MTPAYDPIPELQKLGYTEREAAFLYLVGIHSGYFLRRQYPIGILVGSAKHPRSAH